MTKCHVKVNAASLTCYEGYTCLLLLGLESCKMVTKMILQLNIFILFCASGSMCFHDILDF